MDLKIFLRGVEVKAGQSLIPPENFYHFRFLTTRQWLATSPVDREEPSSPFRLALSRATAFMVIKTGQVRTLAWLAGPEP